MDKNRFENADNDNLEKTQEIDSILYDLSRGESSDKDDSAGSAQAHGITPREEFTDLNSADEPEDMGKTLRMDSIASDDDYSDYPAAPNPVKRRRKKKKQVNHTRTMGQIFLGVLISVAATCLGIVLAVQVIVALKDVTGMAKDSLSVEVEINESMNVEDIAELLYDEGIIEMPSLFKAYIRFSKEESGFLNGSFEVNANMSYSTLITALKTVKTYTETVMVMIPEGYTAQQIGQLLEENYVCRAVDFEKYYESKLEKYDFEESIEDNPYRLYALEGYLFPDTYEFYVIDDLKDNPNFDTEQYAMQAAEKMYANFEDKITDDMLERMDELGLTLDETIILASLIQKEGTNEDNMALISSVFHNRLADLDTFPQLQTDTTYTYIDDCITPLLSESELYDSIVAAYDTYQCVGLPAGAVCNPGIEAINAALYPEESSYYYFLCSSDGVFYYAQTEEQHNQNIIDAALREE